MTITTLPKLTLLAWIASFILVGGCGDDGHAPTLAEENDAGDEEGGIVADGSTGKKDAAYQEDDGAPAQADSGAFYQFGDEDRFEVDIGGIDSFYDQRGFDVAFGTTDFALIYENRGLETECASRINIVYIPTSGKLPKAKTAVNADLSACSTVTEPAVVALNGAFTSIWSDDRSGRGELYSLDLGGSGEPAAITDTESIERHAAVAAVNSNLLAAWIAEDVTTGKRAIYTQLLGVEGSQPVEVVSADAGRMPEDLVLATVGTQKAVLGWVDLNADTRGIFLQRLMSDGSAEGEPQQILTSSSYAYSGSTLDIAGANSGGAAVYAISIGGVKQVEFVRIDAEGRAKTETKLKVIAPPRGQGKDPSLAKWGSQESSQYLVAFRATAGENITEPEVQTTYVDLGVPWEPSKITYSDISSAASEGGRLTVRVANDGTALVAWVDAESSKKKWLRAIRLRPHN